jgi:opacity protein-like surface antigen
MKTSCSTVAAAAMLATSMTFAAAAAGPSQDRIPELQPTSANSATVTGCVARGTATATYMLTNITKEGQATARDAVQRMTVALSGTDVDLSKHVGHRVSVTGPYTSTERVTGTGRGEA